ncbi:MAG: SHOCT domain-containing protein [Oscillospiraceae bacterium]|nr:SHOCT domain-containing protein [Oscillospiraceae bacterium]
MKKCKSCDLFFEAEHLNAAGICTICVEIAIPGGIKGTRNPLEIFGRGNEVLRVVDNAYIFYKDVNKHEHMLPIVNILRVTIAPPWVIHHGALILATAQGDGGLGTFRRPNIQLNFLSKDEIPYAENIQKYILDFQTNAATPVSTPQISIADELVKLKALVDDGILTQEEFDRKKSKLLGE